MSPLDPHMIKRQQNTDKTHTQKIQHNSIKSSNTFLLIAGPRSAVGNVSGYRCVSDCRSRGREFDPGPVQYFRGD